MILLSLLWEFLKIGLFSFGGAYGAIPIIKESVLSKGWADEEMFANIVAISESTPGPIMVNTATYIGNHQAGVLGAAVATFGVIFPSFLIILLVTAFLRSWLKNKNVQSALRGIKPCLMGIILATGIYMAINTIVGDIKIPLFNLHSFIILFILVTLMIVFYAMKKKGLSPILLIVISAVLGIILY